MKFTKMHGAGNDYVYVNAFVENVADPAALAIKIADRHFGVGGNAIRCVAKYAHDHSLSRANPMKIETGRGVLTLQLSTGPDGKVTQATVDMNAPILDLPKIPVDPAKVTPAGAQHTYRVPVAGG